MLGIGLSPIKKIFPVQQQQLMSTDTAGYSTAYILRFQKPFNHTGTQITYARTKLFLSLVRALVSSLHPVHVFKPLFFTVLGGPAQGRASKNYYKLIVVLSTEIFSKRRKIYAI